MSRYRAKDRTSVTRHVSRAVHFEVYQCWTMAERQWASARDKARTDEARDYFLGRKNKCRMEQWKRAVWE